MFRLKLSTLLIVLFALLSLGLSLYATPSYSHCDGVKHGPGHPHCGVGEPGGEPTTVVVSATGATSADNCSLLQDALASITDASATKPYLVKIDPGIYGCGGTPIIMPPFVALEGSGRIGTKIEFAFTETTNCIINKDCEGGVQLGDHTALRELSVENDGAGAGPNVTGVTVAANSDNVEISDAKIVATHGGHAVTGLMIYDGSSVEVHNTHISAIGVNASNFTTGAVSFGNNITTTYHASQIFSDGNGGGKAYGVQGQNSEDDASATTVLIDSSDVIAVNGSDLGIAALSFSGATMRIRGSTIEGSDEALRQKFVSTILVSFSELSGAKNDMGGDNIFQCFSVYDESYVALGAFCD